jgi:DNA-binding NarL/FixJ family response regulator
MTTDGPPIRVILADDSYLVREAIEHVLHEADEVEVVASCGDRDSLLSAIEAEQPDVVVTDIRMPPGHSDEGLRLARDLRASDPDVGVVVLSSHSEPSYALALFVDGSSGRAYLLKERLKDPAELGRAIRTVAAGGSAVDPKLVERLLAGSAPDDGRLDALTPREHEVLAQVAEGRSNAAIAESFAISKRAVEHHVNGIFRKLGLEESGDVSRRVMATLVYLDGSGS